LQQWVVHSLLFDV